jgi:hypothetical protein
MTRPDTALARGAAATEPTLGDQLREDALRTVLGRIPPGDPWRLDAVKAIAGLAQTPGLVFEAYDVIRLGVPEPAHHSRWGAVFRLCFDQGLIELAGAGPSSRPTTKRSLVRFWQGTP